MLSLPLFSCFLALHPYIIFNFLEIFSFSCVLYEWDYKMCPGNGASQCALGMGLANVHWKWDYPMCLGNGTIQCALGMGQANVPWE